MKRRLFCGVALFLCLASFAQSSDAINFESLKSAYIASDRAVQETEIALEKVRLESQKTVISNGTNLTAQSGDIKIGLGDNKSFSVEPSITLDLPQVNDSNISVSSPISIASASDGSKTTKINNAGVTFETSVISKAKKTRDVTLQKVDRNILVAERNVENQKTKTEKQFLSDLQEILSILKRKTTAEDTQIEKQINLEKTIAAGYSEKSATYRNDFMTVKKAERSVREAERELNLALVEFGKNCGGITLTEENILSLEIPSVEMAKFTDYKKENYATLESAKWTNQINSASRDANIPFSLYANGGYGIDVATSSNTETDVTNKLNLGLKGEYKGLSAQAKVGLPFTDDKSPTLTFSVGIDLNNFRTKKIDDALDDVAEKNERLSIEEAEEKYSDDLETYKQKRANNFMDLVEARVQSELAAENEADMTSYYKQQIITNQQYRQAVTSNKNAKVDVLTAKLNCIIYNIDLSLLFIKE